ncbi:RHS repeat-associated core domain-containing protein, partial [Chryseobacterium pennipullorum]
LNGNMTSHIDKNLKSISYNHLNLPNSFKSNSTGVFGNSTSYLYRADGTKLRKAYNYTKRGEFGETSEAQTVTDYLDGFQYTLEGYGLICVECPVPVPDLQFVPTSEGYFDFVKNKYIYNYTDHLGNVRLSYMKGVSGIEIIEENNYYPFGLKHGTDNPNVGNRAYQYKYNGKELQETGMYDYGARFYMPDLGRWGVVDPLAEVSRRFSPYTYVFNNPINFIDPDGRDGIRIIDKANKTITIKAVYYVQTEKSTFTNINKKEVSVKGYSSKEVGKMNKNVNSYLNDLKMSVSEGEYAGYTIKYDLQFKDGAL